MLNGIVIQRIGERLGVPAIVLIIVLTTLVPKIDKGIAIADHVDAVLQVIASSCDVRPRIIIQQVTPP